jgi:hypothetical protein
VQQNILRPVTAEVRSTARVDPCHWAAAPTWEEHVGPFGRMWSLLEAAEDTQAVLRIACDVPKELGSDDACIVPPLCEALW